MTIHNVKQIGAFPLLYAEPHYRGAGRCVTLVRIETRRHRRLGRGDLAVSRGVVATKILVEQGFAPLVVGEDPLDVERLWQKHVPACVLVRRRGIAAFAISAIDMALWESRASCSASRWRSCSAQLRGDPRDGIDHLRHGGPRLDARRVPIDADQGYRIVKAGWGMRRGRVRRGRERDLQYRDRGARGRSATTSRSSSTCLARAGSGTSPTAIERLREWEPFDLRWVEQPLPPADLAGYARLRAGPRRSARARTSGARRATRT